MQRIDKYDVDISSLNDLTSFKTAFDSVPPYWCAIPALHCTPTDGPWQAFFITWHRSPAFPFLNMTWPCHSSWSQNMAGRLFPSNRLGPRPSSSALKRHENHMSSIIYFIRQTSHSIEDKQASGKLPVTRRPPPHSNRPLC